MVLGDHEFDDVEGTVPRTLEAWARAQKLDASFDDLLQTVEDKTLRHELWIQPPPALRLLSDEHYLVWDNFIRSAHSLRV